MFPKSHIGTLSKYKKKKFQNKTFTSSSKEKGQFKATTFCFLSTSKTYLSSPNSEVTTQKNLNFENIFQFWSLNKQVVWSRTFERNK
jgi:hypothetical protein